MLHGQPSLQPCDVFEDSRISTKIEQHRLRAGIITVSAQAASGQCVRAWLFVCSSAWLRGSDSIVLVGRIGSMSAAARQLQAATRLSGCPGILQQLEDFLKLRKASSRRSKGLAASISDSHMPRCTCCGSSRCLLMIAFTL